MNSSVATSKPLDSKVIKYKPKLICFTLTYPIYWAGNEGLM